MLKRWNAAEPVLWVGGISAALLLLFPRGFPNYDTIYYLLWGREIAEGMSPDYGAPLAPTPHPLYDLLGAILAPLGDGAITVTMIIAYASLALVAWLVYRLGREWLSAPVGLVAALVVLTSAPFLSNGLRAYIDIPYIALCLGAVWVVTRRPRAGWPPLALLALAGLLRPEAWIFSGAYLLFLGWTYQAGGSLPRTASAVNAVKRHIARTTRGLAAQPGLFALGVSAPVIWIAFDWVTTGNPLYSLTGTRETVETLERATGPVDVVLYGPRRLGEVLQWPGMIGALFGVVLTFLALRRRVITALAAAGLALVAFALMGAAGLAIIPRYTMLAAAILAVFIGAALIGWRLLPADHRLRRPWQLAAIVVAALYVIWLPNQVDLLERVDEDLSGQAIVERDLESLVDSGAFEPLGTDRAESGGGESRPCLPISAPNHRAVPRLAYWLDIRPSEVISEEREHAEDPGWFLAPAREFTIRNFILDPGDPVRETAKPPSGFELVARNRSWELHRDRAC